MKPARALALAFLAIGFGAVLPLVGAAAASDPGARPGIALIFIEDRISFEQLMAVPAFRELARSGGAALMATDQTYRSRMRDVYLALGAGAGPRNAVPNLLDRVLTAHGVEVCAQPTAGTPADPSLLLAATPSPGCPASGSRAALVVANDMPLIELDEGSGRGSSATVAERRAAILQKAASTALGALSADERSSRMLLMVVSPMPSTAMDRVGDEVTPLIMAEGGPGLRPAASGPMSALTSDTTRRDGLVANVDVASTILQFFGIPAPTEMDGQPIRQDGVVDLFALHRLHLEQRRIRLPIQLGEVAFVAGLGIVGIPLLLALARRGRLPGGVAAAMRYFALCGVALGVVVLAGGLLPRLTWAVVIPYVVVATAGLAAASLWFRRFGPLAPFAFLGAVGLVFIVAEGTVGGRAFAVPLLGGTMFDGVRFYGLPNSFISVLLASALFVAAAVEPAIGAFLLFGTGIFAGFPGIGADVGGSITLFAAAGLWWALRVAPGHGSGTPGDPRGWPWLRMAMALVASVAVGLALVLVANRFLPGAPTHATRFVERATSRFGSGASEIGHRLAVGWRMLNSVPVAYIPLAGLAVVFVLAVAGPGPVGRGLAISPAWRDVVVALVIAAAVAFVANDTGVAASAPAFLYAATVLAYAALLPAAWAPPPAQDRPPSAAREPQEIA